MTLLQKQNQIKVKMNKNLLVIPLVAAVAFLIFPFVAYYGNQIMVITSTSMEPVLKPNDLIVVEKASVAQIEQGDIIAFDSHMEMGIVAHRAIEVYEHDGDLVIDTKEDNAEKEDPWYVTDDDLIGKVKDVIPAVGILLVGPVRFTLVAVIIITAFSMLKEQFSQRKESKKPKE